MKIFSKQGCGTYTSGLWRCWGFHCAWKIEDQCTCKPGLLPKCWLYWTLWINVAHYSTKKLVCLLPCGMTWCFIILLILLYILHLVHIHFEGVGVFLGLPWLVQIHLVLSLGRFSLALVWVKFLKAFGEMLIGQLVTSFFRMWWLKWLLNLMMLIKKFQIL